MLKELKYFLFLFTIFIFSYLSLKYYFSDDNKKNSYRSYKEADEKITILLGEEEYHIARRTVSKYREELGIETSKYRREL